MYDESLFADTVTGFAATLVRHDNSDAVLAEFLERISAVHVLMGSAVTVALVGVLQFPAVASSRAAFAPRKQRPVRPCQSVTSALVGGTDDRRE